MWWESCWSVSDVGENGVPPKVPDLQIASPEGTATSSI